MAGEGEAGLAAAKDATMELLDVLFEWVVPLIFLLVGSYVGSSLGLSGLLYNLIDPIVPTTVTTTTMVWVVDLLAALVWLCIGGALWHAQGQKSSGPGVVAKFNLKRAVFRVLGALFMGAAIGEGYNLTQKKVGSGPLSTASWKIATGNA